MMALNFWVNMQTHKSKCLVTQLCKSFFVATPLWDKCEGEAHTPESGKLESSGTLENSELELKGQNTSHWGVLGVIGKVLKCRCLTGLALAIWTSAAQVMGKRRAGSQTGSLTPDH